MKVLKNVSTYGTFSSQPIDILIDDEGNAEIISANNTQLKATIIDCNNNYAILPGLLDSHIHGNLGYDFADRSLNNDALERITESLGRSGVAFCIPTLVSLSLDHLKQNLRIIDEFFAKQMQGIKRGAAQLVGIHLEGPFIAKNCKGAHDENVLQTKIDQHIMIDLIKTAPHIDAWKITLAPELEGAIQFIKDMQTLTQVEDRNVSIKVFIGHTNADTHYLEAAFNAGAVGFTHLGNANCEVAHRSTDHIAHEHLKSNVVKFALDKNNTSSAYIELITDGHHLSKEFVNFVMKDREDKIILITDALGPTGLADGNYQLGTLEIQKKGEVFYLKNSEKLAGSAATLSTIIKKFSQMIQKEGADLWTILYHAAVLNPRNTALPHYTKLNDQENFVLVDRAGTVVLSVVNKKTIHHTNAFAKTTALECGYFVTKDKERFIMSEKEIKNKPVTEFRY